MATIFSSNLGPSFGSEEDLDYYSLLEKRVRKRMKKHKNIIDCWDIGDDRFILKHQFGVSRIHPIFMNT